MPVNNFVLFRELAACLFLLDLAAFLPFANVCLGPGYWSGTFLDRSLMRLATYVLWAASCLSLLTGFFPLLGALTLLAIFRRIYVKGRWKTLFRGGGAPGFMSHYAILFITLLDRKSVV